MKELLIGIIEFIGNSFEVLSSSKNPKRFILISLGLFIVVIGIMYYLTKDFNSTNVISH